MTADDRWTGEHRDSGSFELCFCNPILNCNPVLNTLRCFCCAVVVAVVCNRARIQVKDHWCSEGDEGVSSDQTTMRQMEMRLIPLVLIRSYAVSVERLDSISFFM